jgi:hypothetical protein
LAEKQETSVLARDYHHFRRLEHRADIAREGGKMKRSYASVLHAVLWIVISGLLALPHPSSGLPLLGPLSPQEKPGQGGGGRSATKGELRWHGTIVRWSKDNSTLAVRKGNVTKTIHYDSSTQWTQSEGGKARPAQTSEFNEGSDVICIGKAGEKGSFVATRIDLRTKGAKP